MIIKLSIKVTSLGVTIVKKRSFTKRMSNMCKIAANQINSSKRSKEHFDMETKRNLTKNISFITV